MTTNNFRPEDHLRAGDGTFKYTAYADSGLKLPAEKPRITADDIYGAGDSHRSYSVATAFLRQNSSDPEAAEWLETIEDREHDHSEYEGAGVTSDFRAEVINRVTGMAVAAGKLAAAEARREIGRTPPTGSTGV